MRRWFAPAILTLLSSCGSGSEPSLTETRPPNVGINVLLLTIDTLRADHLSCYGYPRRTSPAIDRLAERGVVFDRAFTYWPKTRGSFAAMFTSLYASQHGLTVRARDLPDFNQTLAETFLEHGYRTAAAVDNGNLDRALGFAQGFDHYQEVWHDAETEIARTEVLTRFAMEFLAREDEERPFFLWIHYVNPHTPYDPPEELLERFRGDGVVARGPRLETVVGFHGGVNRHLAVPGEDHLGDYVDRYDGEIAFVDEHIGRILNALSESAHADTTLVALTSDHGESLGEHDYYFDHGHDLFNPSLQVPLIVSFPGILPAGERVAQMVSTLDLLPTLLDLTQLSVPRGIQGKSVLPLVRRTKTELHERVYFQNDQHQLAMSDGRYKLISYPPAEDQPGHYELYDLLRDPGEVEDRYPAARDRLAAFQAELERFRTRTVAWQQETTVERRGAPAREDRELSEETLRNLETLGYIGKTEKQEE